MAKIKLIFAQYNKTNVQWSENQTITYWLYSS